MGGSFSWGGGGLKRHPGEQEKVKNIHLGKMRKGTQQGKRDETVPMSACTNAEKGVDGGEERE